jgi:hypothetical protein
MHAGIDYWAQVAVPAGLSGARLAYLGGSADTRVADSFHAVASRLHATRERWDDAALLHVFAADLRGPADARSLTDLLLATDLFSGAGDFEAACAALERAGSIAVRVGRIGDARYCRQRLRLTGEPGCARLWGTLTDLVAPAPGPISFAAPDLTSRVGFGTHLPAAPGPISVEGPDLTSDSGFGAHVPAAPGPIIVDPPDLVEPISSEVRAALSAPALVLPEIAWPGV